MAALVRVPIQEASQTILLPLAGIFVGLSFAWAANAQALLSEPEIEKLSEYLPDGISTYIFTFQLAILVILVTLVAWGLAGLGIFEAKIFCANRMRFSIEWALYFLASLTIRECWHVVLGSQSLVLAQNKIRKTLQTQDSDQIPDS